jgi:hypothetical protein
MSFDGAKVRRFFGSHKHFLEIVCVNSRFFDACQIMVGIANFSYFWAKLAHISGKMLTFAAHYI